MVDLGHLKLDNQSAIELYQSELVQTYRRHKMLSRNNTQKTSGYSFTYLGFLFAFGMFTGCLVSKLKQEKSYK